ncbi:MAG TPA: OmpA family protein [Xanthobacteraceae bacterium]|jgi:outer membrane protein OmpA-like peptidoglycan-associated protein
MKYTNLLFCSLALLLSVGSARAEDPTVEEMVCALSAQCGTPFTDRRVRGITATTQVVRPPASFDITLNFPFNSSEITADSREKLDSVAKALSDPSTVKLAIIISGHTDAAGSAEYNQLLSERRAQAVRQFLISAHGIDPKRLVAKGYGKSRLLLPSDPYNDLNRRVQFQNQNYATASVPASGAPAAPAAVAPAAPSAGKPATPTARPAGPSGAGSTGGEGL